MRMKQPLVSASTCCIYFKVTFCTFSRQKRGGLHGDLIFFSRGIPTAAQETGPPPVVRGRGRSGRPVSPAGPRFLCAPRAQTHSWDHDSEQAGGPPGLADPRCGLTTGRGSALTQGGKGALSPGCHPTAAGLVSDRTERGVHGSLSFAERRPLLSHRPQM